MATKSIYITVRLDVENEKTEQIIDEDVQYIINDTDYSFSDVGDFKITNTEICGIND